MTGGERLSNSNPSVCYLPLPFSTTTLHSIPSRASCLNRSISCPAGGSHQWVRTTRDRSHLQQVPAIDRLAHQFSPSEIRKNALQLTKNIHHTDGFACWLRSEQPVPSQSSTLSSRTQRTQLYPSVFQGGAFALPLLKIHSRSSYRDEPTGGSHGVRLGESLRLPLVSLILAFWLFFSVMLGFGIC